MSDTLASLPLPPFNAQPTFFPPLSPTSTNASNFIPPPFFPPASFPLPPPEFLSKMLQTPPPTIPVPASVNSLSTTIANNSNIDKGDLYDPLKIEEENEEDTEEKKPPIQKTTSRTFNIKKEYTIKIESSISFTNFI